MTNTSRLDALNQASEEQAAEELSACNASRRWIAAVLQNRPYSDAESLLQTAEHTARGLDWDEVCAALDAQGTRRTSAGSGTSSSSAPRAAVPRRWRPNWTGGSATTTRASAPR